MSDIDYLRDLAKEFRDLAECERYKKPNDAVYHDHLAEGLEMAVRVLKDRQKGN